MLLLIFFVYLIIGVNCIRPSSDKVAHKLVVTLLVLDLFEIIKIKDELAIWSQQVSVLCITCLFAFNQRLQLAVAHFSQV